MKLNTEKKEKKLLQVKEFIEPFYIEIYPLKTMQLENTKQNKLKSSEKNAKTKPTNKHVVKKKSKIMNLLERL